MERTHPITAIALWILWRTVSFVNPDAGNKRTSTARETYELPQRARPTDRVGSVVNHSAADNALRTGSLPALEVTRTERRTINHGEQRELHIPHNYMESETTFLYADQVALYTVSEIVETLTKGVKSALISVIGVAFGFLGLRGGSLSNLQLLKMVFLL